MLAESASNNSANMTTSFLDNYRFLARYNRWINQKPELLSVQKPN